jgi:hypothetical protein
MTPERWKEIRAVFEEAQSIASTERAGFLEGACAGDLELCREVESLLEVDSQAGSDFMGVPAVDLMQPESNGAAAGSWVGRRLGPYQIVAEIGHGGMGEVYSASRIDGQFDKISPCICSSASRRL